MRSHGRVLFPIGVYAMLLGALGAIAVPAAWEPVERALLGAASLPLRGIALLRSHRTEAGVTAGDVVRLRERLRQRLDAHAFGEAAGVLPIQGRPELCAVQRRGVPGGADRPAELVLASNYEQLRDCGPLVTRGDCLLGTLAVPGEGVAVDDDWQSPARVVLLNHRKAAPVAGELLQGQRLMRMVVGPAAGVDPGPLRTEHWDDPYRMSLVQDSGLPVRSRAISEPWSTAVPSGLLLGHTMPWGYAVGGGTLAIQVFVVPPFDSRSLSHVVLWRRPGAPVPPSPWQLDRLARESALLQPLPGRTVPRYHVIGGHIEDGAAVMRDGFLLGTVKRLSFGQGLVTPFCASRQRWSLLLLPDDPGAAPVELWCEIEANDGAVAWLRPLCDARLHRGFLFSGGNGRACPAGLLVGHAVPEDSGLLRVHSLLIDDCCTVEVLREGGP